jgi:pyruvate dehydrogenase E2 component (dihydrolipoamide acetyltransferase)
VPFEVRLPDIGEGIAEGEIVRWLVKAGDAVREDQPLVEVMTDKATVEIPSPRTGVIAALLADEGKVVPVGTVIVTIEVGAKAAAGAAPAHAGASAQVPAAARAAVPPPPRASAAFGSAPSYGSLAPVEAIQAAPAVRALARQLGVQVEDLRGSGPGGRVTSDDVRRAANGGGAAPRPAATPASSAGASGGEERIPLRGLRRKIAEHMRHSLDTAAHFTFVGECDMTAVVEHQARTKPAAAARGTSLTYLAYVLKALVEPVRQFPLLNASLDDWSHEIVLKRAFHVGIAAATSEGLTVPVVRDVDRLPLLGIAAEIQRLANAARTNKLKMDELQGGTFTVTTTGAKGGLLATPIIHHPQVAILGVHEVKKKPAVVNDQVVARDMTNLSLSLDHRVVDGAVGAEFLYAVIARLQDLSWLTAAEVG